ILRIPSEDVKKVVASVNKPPQQTVVIHQGAIYEKRVKMTRLRQNIENRLVEVQNTNAILNTFNEVDMSAVMEIINKYKDM
ncbi:dihydrolipoamide succinyltransferase, partial [Francisella tularensis subsp. holarctica]|nr:dihydrolipoamide succinyltransferase [Francisella tularensis subsp. holarctica]